MCRPAVRTTTPEQPSVLAAASLPTSDGVIDYAPGGSDSVERQKEEARRRAGGLLVSSPVIFFFFFKEERPSIDFKGEEKGNSNGGVAVWRGNERRRGPPN